VPIEFWSLTSVTASDVINGDSAMQSVYRFICYLIATIDPLNGGSRCRARTLEDQPEQA
jgi:hypothetical protein